MQTHTHNISFVLRFDDKNGHGNAPECYVIRGSRVFSFLRCNKQIWGLCRKTESGFFHMQITRKTVCRKTAVSRRMYCYSLMRNYFSLTEVVSPGNREKPTLTEYNVLEEFIVLCPYVILFRRFLWDWTFLCQPVEIIKPDSRHC